MSEENKKNVSKEKVTKEVKNTSSKTSKTTSKKSVAKEASTKNVEPKKATSKTKKTTIAESSTPTKKTTTKKSTTANKKVTTNNKTTTKEKVESVEQKSKKKNADIENSKVEVNTKASTSENKKSVNKKTKVTDKIPEKNENNKDKKEKNKKTNTNIKAEVEIEAKTKKEENKEIISQEVTTASDTPKEKKSHKTLIITSICLVVLVVLLLIFLTIFALITNSKNTIINGINIWGIDVSGLTKEEASQKLSSYLEENLSKGITLKHNEYEAIVMPEQFNISFSVDEAVNMAYNKGRSGNVFENNFEILDSMIKGNKINPGCSYDDEIFTALAQQLEPNFSDRLIEPTYYIDETNLVIEKGKDGVIVDKDNLKNDIIYAFSNLGSINNIDIPVINKKASILDLNKVHDEVYKAPQDAYYTVNPYAVYAHSDGIDFEISMEEALNIFNSSEDTCIIPLKVLTPNITTNQLSPDAFPDLLGSYYTNFSTSNWGRTTNIRLATEKIDGTVIMPGEVFSFNQTVGKRTPEAGFQVAAVYAGGEVTTDYGGGICQVSSTLYNSALLANLEIVDRSNHMFSTGYVPIGRDATVSWGAPDFQFSNNRNYPIKIMATVSGGTVAVDIYGLATPDDYEVELESYITQYIGFSTIERPDPTLPKGTTQVIENGSSGCKSVCYRILKKDGEIVDKELLSVDIYDPHNKIVAVGTKQ